MKKIIVTMHLLCFTTFNFAMEISLEMQAIRNMSCKLSTKKIVSTVPFNANEELADDILKNLVNRRTEIQKMELNLFFNVMQNVLDQNPQLRQFIDHNAVFTRKVIRDGFDVARQLCLPWGTTKDEKQVVFKNMVRCINGYYVIVPDQTESSLIKMLENMYNLKDQGEESLTIEFCLGLGMFLYSFKEITFSSYKNDAKTELMPCLSSEMKDCFKRTIFHNTAGFFLYHFVTDVIHQRDFTKTFRE